MPFYSPRGLDYATWWTNMIMGQIYRSTLFLFMYNGLKFIYGCLTGTSEIYRICDAVVLTHKDIQDVKIPYDQDLIKFSIQETKKIYIDPETVYRLDLCILYSKELESFRRPFESWYSQFDISPLEYIEPGSGKKFEVLFQQLLEQKRFPKQDDYLTAQSLVLRAAMTKVYSTFHLLHELNARAATNYTMTNPSHEAQLDLLWVKLMGEKIDARISLSWQRIGFQGRDPSTDFRSMGLLGLDDLVYFASNYNLIAKRILQTSHHPKSWFSFAIVGVNITQYLLRLVRTRQLQWVFYCHGASKEVYHEVYCFLWDSFEKNWISQKKPPTIMDFADIFKAFQVDFEIHLMQRGNVFLKDIVDKKLI